MKELCGLAFGHFANEILQHLDVRRPVAGQTPDSWPNFPIVDCASFFFVSTDSLLVCTPPQLQSLPSQLWWRGHSSGHTENEHGQPAAWPTPGELWEVWLNQRKKKYVAFNPSAPSFGFALGKWHRFGTRGRRYPVKNPHSFGFLGSRQVTHRKV